MPFLLLLSALLTALTGVVTGVRPLDVQIARPAQMKDVSAVVAVAEPAAVGHRHLLSGFDLRVARALADPRRVVLTAAPRLYLDRLRA